MAHARSEQGKKNFDVQSYLPEQLADVAALMQTLGVGGEHYGQQMAENYAALAKMSYVPMLNTEQRNNIASVMDEATRRGFLSCINTAVEEHLETFTSEDLLKLISACSGGTGGGQTPGSPTSASTSTSQMSRTGISPPPFLAASGPRAPLSAKPGAGRTLGGTSSPGVVGRTAVKWRAGGKVYNIMITPNSGTGLVGEGDDEDDDPDSKACKVDLSCSVCMSKPSCIMFERCGHVKVCDECGPKVAVCPMCRAGGPKKRIYL